MTSKPPLRYTIDVETIADDEGETIDSLNATFRRILDITSEDYGHAVRAVHAKGHGVLDGEMTVLPLPPEYAQGIFAQPAKYAVVARISTNPGDVLNDSISVPRGLALKVVGVPGTRLAGSEDDVTQDFVLVNGPAFVAASAKEFLGSLKLLAATTDRAEGAKKVMSAVLRGVESAIEAVGLKSPTVITLGGGPNSHPLGETYFSQTAFRYGEFIAKFRVTPDPVQAAALAGTKVDTSGRPDALREEIADVARAEPLSYTVSVQLCRDAETMSIEDASALWSEEESPFVPVARLAFPAQETWSEDKRRRVDDGMRFSVWTGVQAHRPLGSVNRARRATYEISSEFRARVNRCPIHEPA